MNNEYRSPELRTLAKTPEHMEATSLFQRNFEKLLTKFRIIDYDPWTKSFQIYDISEILSTPGESHGRREREVILDHQISYVTYP